MLMNGVCRWLATSWIVLMTMYVLLVAEIWTARTHKLWKRQTVSDRILWYYSRRVRCAVCIEWLCVVYIHKEKGDCLIGERNQNCLSRGATFIEWAGNRQAMMPVASYHAPQNSFSRVEEICLGKRAITWDFMIFGNSLQGDTWNVFAVDNLNHPLNTHTDTLIHITYNVLIFRWRWQPVSSVPRHASKERRDEAADSTRVGDSECSNID